MIMWSNSLFILRVVNFSRMYPKNIEIQFGMKSNIHIWMSDIPVNIPSAISKRLELILYSIHLIGLHLYSNKYFLTRFGLVYPSNDIRAWSKVANNVDRIISKQGLKLWLL